MKRFSNALISKDKCTKLQRTFAESASKPMVLIFASSAARVSRPAECLSVAPGAKAEAEAMTMNASRVLNYRQ